MASVADSIADAVVSVLGNVTWSPAPATAFTVSKRKIPAATDDQTSVVIVTQGEGEDVEDAWSGYVLVRYPVTVTFGVKGAAKLADTNPIRSWRQQARRALNKPSLTGVSEVSDCWVRGRAPFDRGALDDGWSWSSLTFTFECIESRT
jgi:hypothetical protein